jgi:4-carboxymuconolactone decarboxylase
MSNTTHAKAGKHVVLALVAAMGLGTLLWAPAVAQSNSNREQTAMTSAQVLSMKQLSIAPVGAAMAVGDMPRLNAALEQAFDAGLTVSEAKEILVQLYAYAGFPRSLNALSELMKVVDTRKQRGVQDAAGRDPSTPIPSGQELLALGTANQTKLSGGPVRGALFDFAPQADEYLKTHLFGDIFGRENLDWQSRELATVGALAALQGVEPQLLAHIRISMNVGLTAPQLRSMADALGERGHPEAAARAQAALDRQVADSARR